MNFFKYIMGFAEGPRGPGTEGPLKDNVNVNTLQK